MKDTEFKKILLFINKIYIIFALIVRYENIKKIRYTYIALCSKEQTDYPLYL